MAKDYKVITWISVLSTILLLLLVGALAYWQWSGLIKDFNHPGYELTLNKSSNISPDEKMEIDLWIRDNNLNQYGDPKDTVYAGGTPLFDEKIGKTINRYDYILKKHPERPWQK